MDILTSASLQCGSRNRPCLGERVSGDAVVVKPLDTGLLLAVIDVLGHGPEAHALTPVIDAFLVRYGSADVGVVMKHLHEHLKGSRGAAAGLCAIGEAGRVDYSGIGNTVIRRFGGTETRLVSQDGVLGQNMRTPRPQSLQLESGDVLLLYTDGVSDRFTVKDYPSMFHHEAQDVADNVVSRFGKDHDDATCIAVRYLS
jgi:serine phosphatase RsbU (regulator of sigma subunit)